MVLSAATLVALFALQGAAPPRHVEAAAATLSFPSGSCSGSGATANLAWTPPAGAIENQIDISTHDNGFISGSYQSVGPLSSTASSYTWSGLKTYTPYYWRVDSKMASGYITSDTGIFVICSEQILLAGNPECGSSASAATVSFKWAPSIPVVSQQWIDVTTGTDFAAGTYKSYGPFSGTASSYQLTQQPSAVYNYRIVDQLSDGTTRTSISRTYTVACGTGVDTDLHHTGDTVIYPALGISAAVDIRKVGPDGSMLTPEGKDDIVRYDFSDFPNLGGYAGNGGTTVLAGHLDYKPYYPAVFYTLAKAQPGDVIEYHRADGLVKKYTVSWAASVPFEQSLNPYLASTSPESLVMITCDGTFDESVGGYTNRAIVYAIASN